MFDIRVLIPVISVYVVCVLPVKYGDHKGGPVGSPLSSALGYGVSTGAGQGRVTPTTTTITYGINTVYFIIYHDITTRTLSQFAI